MCKRGLIANSRQEEKRLMWHSESTVWGLLQEHPPLTPLELRILQFVLWMSVFFHSFIHFFSWHELETLIMSEELWNNPSTPEKEIQRSLNCLISHTPRQKGVSLDHRTLLCYWSHAKSGKGEKKTGSMLTHRRGGWRVNYEGVEEVEQYILTMVTGTLLNFHLLIVIAATKKEKSTSRNKCLCRSNHRHCVKLKKENQKCKMKIKKI